MTQIAIQTDDQDTVTIIAGSMAEAMRAAQTRALAAQGYSLQGRVVTHRFAMAEADGDTDMFDGAPMVAATWARTGPAAGMPSPRSTEMAAEADMAIAMHATA